MSSQLSDTDLMLRYKDGDLRAFEMLFERFQKPIYSFVLRSVGQQNTAEEMTQEIFFKVIKNAKAYQPTASFKTYIYSIARNYCVDQSRRAKHRRRESLDQERGGRGEGASLMDRVANDGRSPESEAVDAEARVRIERAIATLNSKQREVFILRQMQELSFKEISQIIGISENTAKSRMRYALEKLRAELETGYR